MNLCADAVKSGYAQSDCHPAAVFYCRQSVRRAVSYFARTRQRHKIRTHSRPASGVVGVVVCAHRGGIAIRGVSRLNYKPPRPPYQLNALPIVAAPPPLPPAEVLCGKYFSLTPLAAADDSAFAELFVASHGDAQRQAIWEFLPYGPFADAEELADFYRREGAGGDPQFYIVQSENGASGVASYLRICPQSYSIEIGHIWHAAQMQGGRANTETAFLLAECAFALGYRRLEWKCNAMNMKSRRAALRLGLAFEGVFRQCTASKGKNRDTAWFAVLDSDWPAVRANIREWLDSPPGTFSLTKKNLPQIEWSLPAHEFWAVE